MNSTTWINSVKTILQYAPHSINILAIGLDDDGITPPINSVYFDTDNDDFLEKITWPSTSYALLAQDLNHNGRIDCIRELFASDMMAAIVKLSLLDANNDGIIDKNDYGFKKLLVWVDANSNGHSDYGELQSLRMMGITAISLKYENFIYANGATQNLLITLQQIDVMDSWYRPKNYFIESAVLQKDLDMFATMPISNIRISKSEQIDTYLEIIENRWNRESQLLSSDLKKAVSYRPSCQEPDTLSQAEMEAALTEDFIRRKAKHNARYIEEYKLISNNLEQQFTQRLEQVDEEIFQLTKEHKWGQAIYNQRVEEAIRNLQSEHRLKSEALAMSYSRLIEAENRAMAKLHMEVMQNISQLLHEGLAPEVMDIIQQNHYNARHLCLQQQKQILAYVSYHEQEHNAGMLNYLNNLRSSLHTQTIEVKPSDSVMIMNGYGKIPPLDIAMAKDNILKQMVENFTTPQLQDQMIDIIYRWAGISHIDPLTQTTSIGAVIELWKIIFIEKLTGHHFQQLGIAKSSGEETKIAINAACTIAITHMTIQFSATVTAEPAYPSTSSASTFYSSSPAGIALNLSEQLLHLGGSHHNDTLIGNDNANYINSEGGDDEVHGGKGNDTIFGASGCNSLFGDEGDDIFIAFKEADYMDGGDGIDTVSYHHFFARVGVRVDLKKGIGVGGHAHGDKYINIENLKGSKFDDLLVGDDNNNVINGMEGDDEIYSLGGDDKVIPGLGFNNCDGGDGIDTISYESSAFSVTINIQDGTASTGAQNRDNFTGFENAIGTNYSDEIYGDNKANKLFSLAGDDTIIGGGGNDTFSVGPGNNKLIGGSGNDRFIIGEGINNVMGGEGHNMVDYSNAKKGIMVDLHQQISKKETGEVDVLADIHGVIGSPHNDTIIGDANNRPLYYSGGGNDYIEGDSWNDEIHSGSGNSTLIGNCGNDKFFVAEGINSIDGGDGYDTINYLGYRAKEYQDTVVKELEMRTRGDLLPSYPGQQLTMPEALDKIGLIIDLSSGTTSKLDRFTGIESVIGSHYNDIIIGDENDNSLIGSDGDDSIYGHNGDDDITCGRGVSRLYGEDGDDNFSITIGAAHLYGGDGYDSLDLIIYHTSVIINMKEQYITYGTSEHYELHDIEAIRSTPYDDVIYDDDGNNEIHAGGGNDTIHLADGYDAVDGGDGDDIIYLDGSGHKLVWGGTGHDTFIITPGFSSIDKNNTIIVDFKNDRLDLTTLPHIHNMADLKIEQYLYDGAVYTAITISENQIIYLFDVDTILPDNFIFC